MRDLYQRSYRQPGLTTDLPDPAVLIDLLKTDFRGSSKDFSRVIELLDALSIERPAKILDFGANWGYGVYQLQRAGYEAIGYEVSIPRAAYSRNLGVEILTDWQAVIQGGPYDVVFSSHVLEHTPDPAEALRKQCEVLNPGGVVIAYCPNGSPSFYAAQRAVFHRLWGRVHPVMLDETFVRKVTTWPIAIGAHLPKDLEGLAVWDRKASWTGSLNTSELLIVLAAPTSMNCE
jgi:SAM-dependent methyltransferase